MFRMQWFAFGVASALVACVGSLGAASSDERLVDAVKSGDRSMVRALLQKAPDVNVPSADGTSPLHWAVHRDDAELVDALIRAGANVKATNRYGVAPLPLAAQNGNATIIARLIAAGADVASTLPGGETVLMTASRTGSLQAIELLLAHGADVNAKNPRGQTPLMWAAARNNWEVADFLLDRGADPNRAGAGWNALHQAVRWRRPNPNGGLVAPVPTGSLDSIQVIKKMIARGVNVNARMTRNGMKDGQRRRILRTGATAFFLAAKNADVEAMKVLLEAGADATIPSLENTTPLMVAAGVHIYHPGEDGGSLASDEGEVLQAVKLCVEHGNDVNAADDSGYTPLHGAAHRGVNSVVEYLVEKGAKLDARTRVFDMQREVFLPPGEKEGGWTPLAIANGFSYSDFYSGQPQTADLLRKLMQARGLSTEGHVIDPKVCLDCIVTHGSSRVAHTERERKLDALADVQLGKP